MVSAPLPLPKVFFQPRPCSSMLAAAGSGPTYLLGIGGAVGFAEGVTAGDQRDGLFVVHRHAAEGLANVAGGCERIGIAVRAFRVDVDQTHLDGGERIFQFAIAGVALVAQPLGFRAPVDVFLRLPDILASAGETERLEAHRFQGAVAGQDHQVGPGDLLAVFLFDRPEQQARLVEVGVVRPAVQRRESLRAGAGAAAPVGDAVGAGAVPGHANEERPVVAEVGRPPVLGGGHQLEDVLLHGRQIEFLELFRVVERLVHRVRQAGVLAQDVQVQLIGPPVAVSGSAACGLLADAPPG